MSTSFEIRKKLNELNAQRDCISKQIEEQCQELEKAKLAESSQTMCTITGLGNFLSTVNMIVDRFTSYENDNDDIASKKLAARKDLLTSIADAIKKNYTDVLTSAKKEISVVTAVNQTIDASTGKAKRTVYKGTYISLDNKRDDESVDMSSACKAMDDVEKELGKSYAEFRVPKLAAAKNKKVDLKSMVERYNNLVGKVNAILKLEKSALPVIPKDITIAEAIEWVLKTTKDILQLVKSLKNK